MRDWKALEELIHLFSLTEDLAHYQEIQEIER